MGCRRFVTETNGDHPNSSLNNMKRVGFEMAYVRPSYVMTRT